MDSTASDRLEKLMQVLIDVDSTPRPQFVGDVRRLLDASDYDPESILVQLLVQYFNADIDVGPKVLHETMDAVFETLDELFK